MTKVNNYNIYCNTCTSWKTKWILESESLTKCPDNISHDVNLNSVHITDSISENNISIKEEDIPTGGHFSSDSVKFSALKNTTTSHTFSWDYPVSVLVAKLNTKADHEGDSINIIVGKDTLVGTLTSDITSGTTTLPVSQTVMDNSFVGVHLSLDDTTKTHNCAHIISKNTNDNTITIKIATTDSFSTGTMVKMSVYYIHDWEFGTAGYYCIGDNKVGGSYISGGAIVTIEYTNNSATTDKTFVGYIDYLY